jgi:hypothetical protein
VTVICTPPDKRVAASRFKPHVAVITCAKDRFDQDADGKRRISETGDNQI